MPQYMIVNARKAGTAIEFTAKDARAVLEAVSRHGWERVDVFEGGEYRFSADLGYSKVWQIYKRDLSLTD